MVMYASGAISFPSLSNTLINTIGDNSAITKRYLYSMPGIAGDTTVNTVLVNSALNTTSW